MITELRTRILARAQEILEQGGGEGKHKKEHKQAIDLAIDELVDGMSPLFLAATLDSYLTETGVVEFPPAIIKEMQDLVRVILH